MFHVRYFPLRRLHLYSESPFLRAPATGFLAMHWRWKPLARHHIHGCGPHVSQTSYLNDPEAFNPIDNHDSPRLLGSRTTFPSSLREPDAIACHAFAIRRRRSCPGSPGVSVQCWLRLKKSSIEKGFGCLARVVRLRQSGIMHVQKIQMVCRRACLSRTRPLDRNVVCLKIVAASQLSTCWD